MREAFRARVQFSDGLARSPSRSDRIFSPGRGLMSEALTAGAGFRNPDMGVQQIRPGCGGQPRSEGLLLLLGSGLREHCARHSAAGSHS
jgi:hypothetical protein